MAAGAIAAAVLIPNVAGWVGLAVGMIKNRIGITWYEVLPKPWYNPPNWLLAIVWTAWYSSMGYASYIVNRDCGGFTQRAALPLSVYGVHLLINTTWTPVFLQTRSLLAGLVHILALDAAAIANATTFGLVNLKALYIMLPFLTWMIFDTSLMFIIWKNNRGVDILSDDQ